MDSAEYKTNRRGFLKLAGAIAASMGLVGYAEAKAFLNSRRDLKSDSIILISDRDPYMELAVPFLPLYVFRTDQAIGKRSRVIYPAVASDLFEATVDNAVQNIVLAGHGGNFLWEACDRSVQEYQLAELRHKRKEGYFIKHMCGDSDMDCKNKRIPIPEGEKDDIALVMDEHLKNPRDYGNSSQLMSMIKGFDNGNNSNTMEALEEIIVYRSGKAGEYEWRGYEMRIKKDSGKAYLDLVIFRNPLGACVVKHPEKLRGYCSDIHPWDFLIDPLPPMTDIELDSRGMPYLVEYNPL